MKPFFVGASLSAALTVPSVAQQVVRTLPGQTGNQFGAAAIAVPDQDGDGFTDLLVGATGFLGGRGAIFCVSGQYLATGVGPNFLWQYDAAGANPGAAFGTSIAIVGNLTGDSAPDFVVGAPNYQNPFGSGVTTGALYLIDGSTHVRQGLITGDDHTQLGTVVVCTGDQDGDGKLDIAATAPGPASSALSNVCLIPGSSLMSSAPMAQLPHQTLTASTGFGAALASGFDLDGDGKFELAVTAPLATLSGAVETGFLMVIRPDNLVPLFSYVSGIAGEHMGQSVDATSDYDGDGLIDFVVGAPNWTTSPGAEMGRAVVLSSYRLLNHALPYELFVLTDPVNAVPSSTHFGASVRASADLNGDGVGEILVGAPDFFTIQPVGFSKGAVTIHSGATGVRIGRLTGASNDHLGDALVGAFQDLNGDGFPEFAVAGSLSDNPTTDCGTLKCVSPFPCFPVPYCTGKLNSLGCTPAISWNGSSSASSGAPFLITCSNQINQKSGFLTYSHLPLASPFQGGFLCLHAPIVRTPAQVSGGSASGADCSGTYSFDFKARIQSGIDPTLIAGAEVFCQYRSRDPQSASMTSLSNALRFVINP